MNSHFVSANSFLVNGSMYCIPLSAGEMELLFCNHFTNTAFGVSLAQSYIDFVQRKLLARLAGKMNFEICAKV